MVAKQLILILKTLLMIMFKTSKAAPTEMQHLESDKDGTDEHTTVSQGDAWGEM